MKRKNRMAWCLVAILAAMLLGGVGSLGVGLRPYWVARNHGVLADLHKAMLIRAPLSGANLAGVNLQRANLRGAALRGARLGPTQAEDEFTHFLYFREVDLTGADLTGADLSQANLLGANLHGAVLRHASLREAQLELADLTDADLTGADLTGAECHLDHGLAQALGVRYNAQTRWPAGFDPQRHGAVRMDKP